MSGPSLPARESSVNRALNGTVYFLRAGFSEMVKIGWTNGNLAIRIQTIQPGCWHELRLIRQVPGTRKTEAWFHRQFAHRLVAREWFRFDEAMLTVEPVLTQVSKLPAAIRRQSRGELPLFASRLRELRNVRGRTQEDVAKAIGISRSYLAGMEANHEMPGRDVMAALAAFYGVSVANLYHALEQEPGANREAR